MENQIGKYIYNEQSEPSMTVRHFTGRMDEKNNAVLQWEWPGNVSVKLMLVFELADEAPDVARFLRERQPLAVITRDLASRYQCLVSEDRQRYMICPAYFNERHAVVVYGAAYVTNWLYKKIKATGRAAYKPLRLSKYRRVSLSLTLSETDERRREHYIAKALHYGIYEDNRLIGRYPLDDAVAAGNHYLFITKNQTVKFIVEADYAHLIVLDEEQKECARHG